MLPLTPPSTTPTLLEQLETLVRSQKPAPPDPGTQTPAAPAPAEPAQPQATPAPAEPAQPEPTPSALPDQISLSQEQFLALLHRQPTDTPTPSPPAAAEQPATPAAPLTPELLTALLTQLVPSTTQPSQPPTQTDADAPETQFPLNPSAGLPVTRTTDAAPNQTSIDSLSAEYERLLTQGELVSTQLR